MNGLIAIGGMTLVFTPLVYVIAMACFDHATKDL